MNFTLEKLEITYCRAVSLTGWMAPSVIFGSTTSKLKTLDLKGNSVCCHVLDAFANAMIKLNV
jgi:hypothetical protein